MEAGVLINKDNQPIYWHLPNNRTVVSLPDSRKLWEIFWENKHNILGFAHSHPGRGLPAPSYEDITTFSAIEIALGKRLQWWIISDDKLIVVRFCGPEKLVYDSFPDEENYIWIQSLREHSKETYDNDNRIART